MSEFPSMPLFTDAFIADTGHLTAQQTGAYLMLLMMAWRMPGCSLPDDDERLARWARVDPRTWSRIKIAVMEFWTLTGGRWTQKRLLKEREIVSKRAEVARENGKHGGRPKSLEIKEPENPAGSLRVSQKKAPNPNPNPIEKKELLSLRESRRARARVPLPDCWQPDEADIGHATGRGFTSPQIQPIAAAFANHHRAKGSLMADWHAAWRTWVDNEIKFQGNGQQRHANGHPPKRTVHDAANDLLERIRSFDAPPEGSLRGGAGQAAVRRLPPG